MTNVDVADLVRLLEQKVDVILEMLGVDSNILPQPNTKEEWKEFGIMWLDGRGNELQWMDTSEHGDEEWYDMEYDDAWYPYDINLVYRRK